MGLVSRSESAPTVSMFALAARGLERSVRVFLEALGPLLMWVLSREEEEAAAEAAVMAPM